MRLLRQQSAAATAAAGRAGAGHHHHGGDPPPHPDPLAIEGFVNIRIKPPVHSRGIRT